MGHFGPQEQHFRLPDNAGDECYLEGLAEQKKSLAHKMVPDLLLAPSSSERHELILAQFIGDFFVSVIMLTMSISGTQITPISILIEDLKSEPKE